VSKLDELIQEYCPEGVEYISLGSLCKIETGKLNANAAVENGPYLFFTTAKEISRIDKYRWDTEALLIAGNANVGDVKHYEGKFDAYQRTYVLNNFDKSINVRFLYFFVSSALKSYLENRTNSAAMTYIVLSTLQDFKVPIPPLEVQKEIVNILDKFTQLEAELSAELDARRKQYEYYREKIIIHDNIGAKIALNAIAKIGDGLHGTPKYSETGEYYFINGNNLVNGELYFSNNTKKVNEETYKKHFIHLTPNNSVLMSINGTIGSVSMYGGENVMLGKSVAYFNVFTEKLHSRYLYHMLQTRFAKKYFESSKTGSTIKNLGLKALRDFEVPIPPMDTQLEIVDLLDKFEKLSYSTVDGLPSEIQIRRQQYEYYRTKLLTFQELSA
jgi:type I restriction enzyme S subunit